MARRRTADRQNALNELLGLQPTQCDLQLCLASPNDDDVPLFQRVQITEGVVDGFRETADDFLSKKRRAASDGDLALRDYDPQTKMDAHEVECIDLSTQPDLASQISGLADPAGMDVFSEDDDFVNRLRFYVTALSPPQDGDPAFLFRTYTPKKELSRSASFAIMLRRGQYDRIRDSVFLFDQHIDCAAIGGVLFIFNKSNFHRIFRFYEMLIQTAHETLEVIRERVPIDDFAAFAAACEGHLQKIAKLKNIAAKPYLQQLTIADLKKVINKYSLPIETTGTGPNEQIVFDSSDRWAILRLLDDDYLESVMTGESYEANSKRAIQG